VKALGAGAFSEAQATPAGLSAAPGGLTAQVAPATGVGSGQVKLAWIAPSANGSPISDYLIQQSIDGTTWTTLNDGVSTARTYLVAQLTNGTATGSDSPRSTQSARARGPPSSRPHHDGNPPPPADCERRSHRPPASAAGK
jgi:hypothetical protein